MHQKWRGQMILWEMNNKVWEQLPKETQTQCRKLIADLLVKALLAESQERKEEYERENQTNPS
jgi:hypothetical protein